MSTLQTLGQEESSKAGPAIIETLPAVKDDCLHRDHPLSPAQRELGKSSYCPDTASCGQPVARGRNLNCEFQSTLQTGTQAISLSSFPSLSPFPSPPPPSFCSFVPLETRNPLDSRSTAKGLLTLASYMEHMPSRSVSRRHMYFVDTVPGLSLKKEHVFRGYGNPGSGAFPCQLQSSVDILEGRIS